MNNALISAREDEFMEGSRLSLCTASELFCLFFAYPSMTKNLGGQAIQSREVIGNFLNSALMFVSCWIVCWPLPFLGSQIWHCYWRPGAPLWWWGGWSWDSGRTNCLGNPWQKEQKKKRLLRLRTVLPSLNLQVKKFWYLLLCRFLFDQFYLHFWLSFFVQLKALPFPPRQKG